MCLETTVYTDLGKLKYATEYSAQDAPSISGLTSGTFILFPLLE